MQENLDSDCRIWETLGSECFTVLSYLSFTHTLICRILVSLRNSFVVIEVHSLCVCVRGVCVWYDKCRRFWRGVVGMAIWAWGRFNRYGAWVFSIRRRGAVHSACWAWGRFSFFLFVRRNGRGGVFLFVLFVRRRGAVSSACLVWGVFHFQTYSL